MVASGGRSTTTYLKVEWDHDDTATEPVVLYSELDEQRYESRKVEQYADGRLDYADAYRETGTTSLGEAPVPSFGEIAGLAEFRPTEIARREFEQVWQRAARRGGDLR